MHHIQIHVYPKCYSSILICETKRFSTSIVHRLLVNQDECTFVLAFQDRPKFQRSIIKLGRQNERKGQFTFPAIIHREL